MDLEEQRLRLERQRLALEVRLKRRDQQFQRQQFETDNRGLAAWSKIISPVGAAVIAGIAGLFGTVCNGYQSNQLQDSKQRAEAKLEREKLEGSLILDAIKTTGNAGDKEKQTAANLVFLSDAGLIQLSPEKIRTLRAKAKDALPSLPSVLPGSAPSDEPPLAPTEEIPVPAKHYRAALNREIDSIVVHATGARETLDQIVRLFHTSERSISAHYVIGRDGRVAQTLDDSLIAMHAGMTSDFRFSNNHSIGVELVGIVGEPFPEVQLNALRNLLVRLAKLHKIDPNNIVGHSEVAMPQGRKDDPGPTLDLKSIRAYVRSKLDAAS